MSDKKNKGYLVLKDVEIQFPHLFERDQFDKYSARFAFPKDRTDLVDKIKTIFKNLQEEKGVIIKNPDMICMKDGDVKTPEYNQGTFFINSSSIKPPIVINEKGSQVTEENFDPEEQFLSVSAFDQVNALVTFWLQNNKHGQRINAQLNGIVILKSSERSSTSFLNDDESKKILLGSVDNLIEDKTAQPVAIESAEEELPF